MEQYSCFTDKQALKYLRAFGLNESSSSQYLAMIRSWEQHSGVEWTIKRLKSLKVAYIRKLGGLDPWTYTPWVSKDSRKGIPKGPLRVIFGLPKAKAIGCLMIYTMWVAKVATKSQLTKFTDGVNSTYVDPLSKEEIKDLLAEDTVLRNLDQCFVKASFSKLDSWYGRNTLVPKPVTEDLSKVRSAENSLETFLESSSHPLAIEFMRNLSINGECPDHIYNVYAKSVAEPLNFDLSDAERNVVGIIGFIQEPGCKLRTIANPFPIFQLLTSRMGNALYRALQVIPEDCTHDQESGVKEIQSAIMRGEELVAFDLSSATDRFPAEVTFKLLELMGVNPLDLKLFKDLSRGQWIMPNGKEIAWTNGQPLGVYPSFAAFALSHHLVVRSLKPRFYRILGDDLVISKECSARALALYTRLGVPISMDKSIDSPTLTEFGGRLITSTEIIAQPKWRVISDRSFVDLARSLGPKVFHLLRPRQARIIKLLGEIPSDVHPYGLGWNPDGLSYNERLVRNKTVIEQLISENLELKGDSLSSNGRLLIESKKLLLSEYPLRYFDMMKEENDTSNWGALLSSDTKTRLLASAHIRYIKVSEDTYDETRDLQSAWHRVMEDLGDPRGKSALEILERKLRSR